MANINSVVLMSDANYFSIDQPINPYYKNDSLDHKTAINEHIKLENTLIEAGINVVTVPSPIDCQDGVYTANWALVKNKKAVLARLPSARKNEEKHAADMLSDLGIEVLHVPDNLKFSGQGDALVCGDLLFCGSGYRSDEAAQEFAAKALGLKRIQLQTIPQLDHNGKPVINKATGWADSYFYDIDLSLAVIKAPSSNQKGLIAYCPAAFMPASQLLLDQLDSVEKMKISIDEAKKGFAANLISNGETVIMSSHAPKFAKKLRKLGLEIITPDITELAKGGGYIRCMTLSLN